jgi:hypothetical protein
LFELWRTTASSTTKPQDEAIHFAASVARAPSDASTVLLRSVVGFEILQNRPTIAVSQQSKVTFKIALRTDLLAECPRAFRTS